MTVCGTKAARQPYASGRREWLRPSDRGHRRQPATSSLVEHIPYRRPTASCIQANLSRIQASAYQSRAACTV